MLVRTDAGAADISQLPEPSCQIEQLLAVLPSQLRLHIESTFDKGKELREIVMDAGNPTMLYTLSGTRHVHGAKLTIEDVEESYALVGEDKFGPDNRAGIEGKTVVSVESFPR
jgi:stage III sporulation protein SpoIIIAA